MFDVLVVVVVVDLFMLPPLLVVELVVVVLLLFLPLFDGLILVAGVIVDAGDVAGLLTFVFVFVAVLVLVSPGQAAPNKPNVKTAERAITFFISIKFSCLLQRMYVYLIV